MRAKGSDLKERCIEATFAFLEGHAPGELSLREIARRLNVSHQAPYKHFANREQLLAVVTARAFSLFADALEAVALGEDPERDLQDLGLTYLRYAAEHPLHYKLMFGAPLGSLAETGLLNEQANRAFQALLHRVTRARPTLGRDEVLRDALALWSTVHGIAMLQGTGIVQSLNLAGEGRVPRPEEVLARIQVGCLQTPA